MFTDDESSDEELHDNFSVENESSYHRTIINISIYQTSE